MGLFGKKKRSDTIDFTKMSDARMPRVNKDYKLEGDAVDLRKEKSFNVGSGSSEVADPFAGVSSDSVGRSSSSGSDLNSGGMFGFLDSSSSSSASSSSDSSGSSYPSSSPGMINDISEVSVLKTNMRKMSGQIEDHSNEVYRLMQRIELLEKKIDRLEGR